MDCCGLGENGEDVNGELVFKEDFPGGRCSVGGWVVSTLIPLNCIL